MTNPEQPAPEYTRPKPRALVFNNESLEKADMLANGLLEEGPFNYDLITMPSKQGEEERFAMVLEPYAYNKLFPLLQRDNVPFQEVQVIGMNELPPEEQARRRGLRR